MQASAAWEERGTGLRAKLLSRLRINRPRKTLPAAGRPPVERCEELAAVDRGKGRKWNEIQFAE